MIRPHPAFRLFATANTVGLGDTTGLYHGTQQINQGQMDRWNIVATLNYLPHDGRGEHRARQGAELDNEEGRKIVSAMVRARRPHARGLHQRRHLHRDVAAHRHHLGRNVRIFGDVAFAFRVTFLNKCDEARAADGGRILPALLRRRARRAQAAQRPGCTDVATEALRLIHGAANDGPIEAFRQVTAAAMRAVAQRPEMTVSFAPEGRWLARHGRAPAGALA